MNRFRRLVAPTARRAHRRLAPRSAAAALLASFLFACSAVGPDHEPPQAALPPAWQEPIDAPLAGEPAAAELPWWQRLGDPQLASLVERALAQGLDLRQALARVREARALRGEAAAERLPQLDAEASAARRGESDNTPFGAFVPTTNDFAAGFDASWEVDLWGRVRRSVEAADAELAATVEAARDVALTLAAETARHYVDLRSFQARARLARWNVSLQEQTLALVRARNEAGLVGARDVAQAASNVELLRARIPPLELGERRAQLRLAVLLGLPPGALAQELAAQRPIPPAPARLAVGVPADLVRRRADVREAERRLAAETARIGVAQGDLYPRLTLLGSLGVAAEHAPDLLERDSVAFSIGPSLRWNLFDHGRLRRRVEAQDARAEQALVAWERSVLVAVEEAESAMSALVREQSRQRSLGLAADEARRAVDLARTDYQEGLSDFQVVLDSQRTLADVEDARAESDAAVVTHAIALWKALGGGFEAIGGEGPAARS